MGHYENDTFVSQNTIIKIYIDYTKIKGRITITEISFLMYDVDRYDCLDFDYFDSDKLFARTPAEAANMVKKWAKKYCPEDLEQIERNFNTQFFEGFLQECLLDIKEKEL